MAITNIDIERAVDSFLSTGPWHLGSDLWIEWLNSITAEDLEVCLSAVTRWIDLSRKFDPSDRRLLALLECLREAGKANPGKFLRLARDYQSSLYLPVFLWSAGAVASDEVVDWLSSLSIDVEARVNDVRLIASALYEIGSARSRLALQQLVTNIPYNYGDLRAWIEDIIHKLSSDIDAY